MQLKFFIFFDQKLQFIYLSLGLYKGCSRLQVTGEAFSPQKRHPAL
jgi:hypothetical protein